MTISRPLFIQSDGTLLLDERHPDYAATRNMVREIAELRKRPGFFHTYRISPVTLWHAAASGWTAERVVERLAALSRFGLPTSLEDRIRSQMGRYGVLRLIQASGMLLLVSKTPGLLTELNGRAEVAQAFEGRPADDSVAVKPEARGWVKRKLAELGYPVVDEAGYRDGKALDARLRQRSATGEPIRLRDYQAEAVEAFLGDRSDGGGSGVVVLPCGAGKTWVGMAALAKLKRETLILTPNRVSVSQWIEEIVRNTTLTEADIGEYTGETKNVRPVTVATYQVLTHRRSKEDDYPHWQLFVNREWGLIIYDEVHLLPAPVFRMTADLQATRRLGLTATLVREDGREEDAFALIGPKRYEVPWRTMEEKEWIAEAVCTEVRVPMDERSLVDYEAAPKKHRHRIAGQNPMKTAVVRTLLNRHSGTPTLIIGQYLDQLHELADELSLPLITGEMPHRSRKQLFQRFKDGEIGVLVVSKIANFAVDLPDAAVAIQVSGSFGSRQEEAQRLGRILRPKASGVTASFYSVVSDGTDEIEFSRNRGRFLLEQGYPYTVDRWGLQESPSPSKRAHAEKVST
ncbi:DNA repair helicase XPB [Cohnella sp. GCM10027633]|uniref:DNA repair helicase XPB n=1 Tax=unclassified Cohnella TaxID=2636738 RepID=UPI00362782E4